MQARVSWPSFTLASASAPGVKGGLGCVGLRVWGFPVSVGSRAWSSGLAYDYGSNFMVWGLNIRV